MKTTSLFKSKGCIASLMKRLQYLSIMEASSTVVAVNWGVFSQINHVSTIKHTHPLYDTSWDLEIKPVHTKDYGHKRYSNVQELRYCMLRASDLRADQWIVKKHRNAEVKFVNLRPGINFEACLWFQICSTSVCPHFKLSLNVRSLCFDVYFPCSNMTDLVKVLYTRMNRL